MKTKNKFLLNPEQLESTEAQLKQSGFCVELCNEGLSLDVFLTSRKLAKHEVAFVLQCESNQLGRTGRGVLIS